MLTLSDSLSYFDAIYVINLDSRSDKMQAFTEGLIEVGLSKEFIDSKIKRFSGIVSPRKIGYEGCLMSHIQIIRDAKSLGLDRVLVFEDDARFIGSIDTMVESIEQAKSIPWDVFYFGYNCVVPVNQIDLNLIKLVESYTTHAIAYNSSFFDYALKSMDAGLIKIIDVWLAKDAQYKFNCIGSYPMQFSQRPGFSDVENRQVDYDFIVKRSIKNVIRLNNA
jgi:hypothetical protein